VKRIYFLKIIIIFALLSAPIVSAQETFTIPPDEFIYCTVCHGINLMGNKSLEAPRLSQMSAWYVEQQLYSFKNGWRGTHVDDLVGMEMRPMASILSNEQISKAAKFVNKTRSPLPIVNIEGDVETGKKLFQTCIVCHAENAQGNELLRAPTLTGLNDWYLIAQLKNYKKGIRGNNSENIYGLQMQTVTHVLEDDQTINDVVKYILTMQTN